MSDPSGLSDRLTRALATPARGVLGLVDDLLQASREHDLRLAWQAGHCQVNVPKAVPPIRIEVPLQKSVVRAVLARVATLCNEHVPGAVSPYRGQGEVAVGSVPAAVIRVRFVNTPDEQSLELSPTDALSTRQAGERSPGHRELQTEQP